jgi:hypothetical protein
MPKDKNLGKHKSRFEVRGGVINEFDYSRNQAALAEEERERFARQEERRAQEGVVEGVAPQAEAERLQQVIVEAHDKVQQRREKEQPQGSPSRSGRAKKATKKARPASKAAARSTKKSSAKKTASKAGAKKAVGTKKGAARKVGGKKSGAKKKKGGAGSTRKASRAR